ncbi:(2,3-dihydroxybenzoyl)adenylate synthase [Saccharopolyspora spinosa]|uniref:(2,3-dihydroxybenzoyl)adenylate synthase n=1 Tax=Saccharopolyspora spinosa TaxID=60894 RepID=UPI0002378F7B|nr:AMP-binding protein [Saccharopolyspora spinosa]
MLAGCVEWPDEVAAEYRRKGYWRDETLGGLLRRWAAEYGQRTAVVRGEVRWSYVELDRRADRLAAGFAQRGIGSGDRVVVHLPNIPEFVAVCFALFRLGAVPVFALPPHRSAEIRYLCEYSAAIAYVVPESHAKTDYRLIAAGVVSTVPSLRHVFVVGDPGEFTALADVDAEPAAVPEPGPADVAFFLLSGGTTGLPKLIPRTHRDYAYNVRITADNAGLDVDTTYLAVLPAAHNYALGCPGVLGALSVGGTVVLADSGNPDEAFTLIEREKVTMSALVPPLALLWTDTATERDLSSLRLVQVGGSRFEAAPAARFRARFGCVLQQSFGMAEGLLSQTALSDSAEVVDSTQGLPLSPDDEVRLVDADADADADAADVAVGEVGHLLVRGPYTIRGYYHAPEQNQRDFTPDGFFRTGDLARRTPEGRLIIEGRVKDVINRGGEKVAAEEVEGHLLAHEAVREVAVVAVPDAVMGERTCAFVVGRAAVGAAELKEFLRGRGLAAYKLPDRWEQVESLPRTAVGKIDKALLREQVAAKVSRASASSRRRRAIR